MYFTGTPSALSAIHIIIVILAIKNNFNVKFGNQQHLLGHDFLPWENTLLICNIDAFRTLTFGFTPLSMYHQFTFLDSLEDSLVL